MSKQEESTTALFEELVNSDMKHGFEDYEAKHNDAFSNGSFRDFINDYLSKHPDLTIKDIVKRSGMNADYARQILNDKHKASKDYVIALCLSAKMSLKDTQRALKLTNNSILYPKLRKDMALIICINNGCFDISKVNDYLAEHDCPALELTRK